MRHIQNELHDYLVDSVSSNDLSREEIDLLAENFFESQYPLISIAEKEAITNDVDNEIKGFGKIEKLLQDETINEIMINAFQKVYIEQEGALKEVKFEIGKEELIQIIKKIAARSGSKFDSSAPILDSYSNDGSRVHAVLDPIAQNGPYLTIRKFKKDVLALNQFTDDKDVQALVRELYTK
ncbi:MAG: ATPase, T2SS/T4P/T4SS family [Acidimicrobiia bacterium]